MVILEEVTNVSKVIRAISLISVPVGPHGSLLVADRHLSIICALTVLSRNFLFTISNLHLRRRIPLGDVLDRSNDLRHRCNRRYREHLYKAKFSDAERSLQLLFSISSLSLSHTLSLGVNIQTRTHNTRTSLRAIRNTEIRECRKVTYSQFVLAVKNEAQWATMVRFCWLRKRGGETIISLCRYCTSCRHALDSDDNRGNENAG